MNLMLNAFAAMGHPGRPDRRLRVRTFTAPDGGQVVAEFEDSGTGIAAAVIHRLFEPFVTTKPDGLGMGLSICRTIVDQHRGGLRAANNPGGGATFTLTLPASNTSPPGFVASPLDVASLPWKSDLSAPRKSCAIDRKASSAPGLNPSRM